MPFFRDFVDVCAIDPEAMTDYNDRANQYRYDYSMNVLIG